jgi:hypothetical protein
LPFKIKLTVNGFTIRDSSGKTYPLYLKVNPFKIFPDSKHQISFENGLILLDRNI